MDLAFHGEDYIDGEDGDDYMEAGGKDDTLYGGAGNDNMWGAIYLIAYHARYSGVTDQFDCEGRALKVRKQCFQWPLDLSNIKTAHARSMRLAGHKGMGRRMDSAWGSSGIQTNAQKREVPQ